jgi:hypothetical protein
MSSLLVQVTVVPAFTVSFGGLNVKLSTDTVAGTAFRATAGAAMRATTGALAAPSAVAMSALRAVLPMDTSITG